jgi:acylphosphatase
MTDIATYRLRIEGRVQGVGFRGWMMIEARSRAVAGWVRNRSDGTVEAVVSGPHAVVEDLVARCRRGPPGAHVLAVRVDPAPVPPDPGFHYLPTN